MTIECISYGVETGRERRGRKVQNLSEIDEEKEDKRHRGPGQVWMGLATSCQVLALCLGLLV
mgnify:CR=1 FL=1